MYLPQDRLRVLVVEDSKTELNLAHRLLSPHHDVDLVRSQNKACDMIMSAQIRRYDWVLIGDPGVGHGIGAKDAQASSTKTSEDIARTAQRSGVHAATIHYIDIMKPLQGQSGFLKIFDRRSGSPVSFIPIEDADHPFLHFDLAYRLISKSTFGEIVQRLQDLQDDPHNAPEEFVCRNWPMIIKKLGLSLATQPDTAKKKHTKEKPGSVFHSKRMSLDFKRKG